ncbi:hypothetical protein FB45DRAFT_927662 [Roridomyces roridus]|uniref:ARM repeat-containing protein n=1 Tax=Roridomyces roridus TaxID=1738132 RepID=A0AAD7BIX8_9AGAR|nr:hypothetical protein FB45DRAFT_927662 [Roridomyces roridus]
MPALQRQDSRPSIHSWWSDSNSLLHSGPTINLHAAAKPLMRFMYHRQALGLIESNRAIRLSQPVLEDLSSYLLCKYVSHRTQWTVLQYLNYRARWHDGEAQEILNSPVLDHIPQLLVDENLRELTISLLETLLARTLGRSMLSILEPNTSEYLLRGDDPKSQHDICLEVTAVLARYARHPQGEHPLLQLLESNRGHMRWWACKVIIYFQDAPEMERWFPATKLVKLLRDEDGDVRDQATYALARAFERRPGIAAPIVAAATRENSVKELCAGFARKQHSLALSILLDQIPMKNWLDDLSNMDEALVEQTLRKLIRVSQDCGGSDALRLAGIQDHLPQLLSGESASIRSRTCELVDNLPGYHTWAPDMLPTLRGLSKDDSEPAAIELAYALNQMTEHLHSVGAGATILLGTNILKDGPSRRSQRVDIRYPLRNLIWTLVKHNCTHFACDPQICLALKSVIDALVGALPIQGLLDFVRSQNVETVKTVAQTLVQLSRWPGGVEALVTSPDFNRHLSGLFASPTREVHRLGCMIMENMTRYNLRIHVYPGIVDEKYEGPSGPYPLA